MITLRSAGKNVIRRIIPQRVFLSRRVAGAAGIALTFDDGPHPVNTEKILDVLRAEDVPATFFLSGSEIEKYPHIARHIHAEGHGIGNHGFFHKRCSEIGFSEYSEGIERTNELIFDITKSKCRIFRPPYGEINFRLAFWAVKNKTTLVSWTIDSGDSFGSSALELTERMDSAAPENGDIILFHDDYQHTAQALRGILQGIKTRKIACLTIENILRR